MLDQMGDRIDAVTVSTPDHMHAIVASAAMKRNKAVFVQKPLTQTIYEARYLRKMAKDRKLVTQMGNQGSAADGLRLAVQEIQGGVIGRLVRKLGEGKLAAAGFSDRWRARRPCRCR